jgi:uncharacterized protein (TIGR04141 family)
VYRRTRDGEQIDLKTLKSDRLIATRADGEVLEEWPLYRCIVYQLEEQGYLNVLTAGRWFRVEKDYKDRVYAQVEAIPRRTGLPDAEPDASEADYNIKAAAAIGGLCLDNQLIQDDGPDRMELCDILTRDPALIHVKHRGSSSTLSHLFAQGLNSAQRLLEQDFRTSARALTAAADPTYADVLPAAQPLAADYEICFAVITRSTRPTPLTLPFFSVISLATAARNLRGYGFKVTVAAIQQPSA